MNIVGCFLLAIYLSSCEAQNRPRGVSLSKASLYKENERFTCLDGSATIDFSKVNDDYCDCRDASDEPGTSACTNGWFYCENKNYKGRDIPSSRVNDGICDCCDGSDEYSGLVSCKNECWDLGKAARAEAERKKKMREEGHRVYREYVDHVKATLETKHQRIDQITKELTDLTAKKTTLEEAKNEAETPEKEAREKHEKAWQEVQKAREAKKKKEEAVAMFMVLDTDKDQKISIAELQARKELDTDSSGDVSEEEVKTYMDVESVDVDRFVENVWPALQNVLKKPESEKPKEPTEDDKDKEEDKDEDPSKEDKVSPETPDVTDDKKDETKQDEDKMPDYDEDTKKLITVADAARTALQEVETKVSNLEGEKEDLKKLVGRDYGPDGAFFKLADANECYEYTDREYVYQLCLFRESTQRPKDGGGSTSLGHWGRWSGPEDNTYSEMLYENGQSCWNGPNRSTRVKIQCGSENKVESATEPSRCEYMFVFSTPAACSQDPQEAHKEAEHDEL